MTLSGPRVARPYSRDAGTAGASGSVSRQPPAIGTVNGPLDALLSASRRKASTSGEIEVKRIENSGLLPGTAYSTLQ